MKKLLSLLLAFVILVSTLPVVALAEEAPADETTEGAQVVEALSAEESEEPVVTEEVATDPPAAEETEAPETEAPQAETTETEAPAADEPTTEATQTDAVETEAPATETEAPATDETDAQQTQAPETAEDYTLTASSASVVFDAASVGYTACAAQTVTVTNSGNASMSVSLGSLTNFTLTALSATTLAAGDNATFTVQPKLGLAAGSYSENLTVSSDHDTSATVSVSFTVNAVSAKALAGVISTTAIPSPPTLFTATSESSTSVYLTWKVATAGSGYELQRSYTSSFTTYYRAIINDITTSNYTRSGLTCGTTYYFRIRTYSTDGTTTEYSEWSKTASVVPAPESPSNFIGTAVTPTSVKLTWDAVSGVTGYKIYRDDVLITTLTSTYLTYTNTGLTAGDTYVYDIYSYVTSSGSNIQSEDPTELEYTATPPSPTSLKYTSASSTSILLSWKAISDVTGYWIFRSANGGETFTKIATVSGYSNNSYTDDADISVGVQYRYYVESYLSTTLYSDPSDTIIAQTVPLGTTNAAAVSASDTSIKLTWTASTDNVSGYIIYYSATKSGDYDTLVQTTSTSYVDTGLTTGEGRYYRIYSYITVGTTMIMSVSSNILFAVPLPAAPKSFTLTNRTYSSVRATWTASTGAMGYELRRSLTSSSSDYTYRKVISSGTTESYNDYSLTCGTTYYYKIRAFVVTDGVTYYGPFSSAVSISVKPLATTSVTVTVASSTSIKVQWDQVSDVSGYKLYIAINGASKTYYKTVSGAASLSYTATGLVPGNKYRFYVYAYRNVDDVSVTSAYTASDVIQLTMVAPTGVKVAAVSASSFKLVWTAVSGATSYIVYGSCSEDPTYTLEETVTTNYYTLTGVTPGYHYSLKVKSASNSSGTTIYSDASSTVEGVVRPLRPSTVKAAMGTTGIKLTWSAVSWATGYYIYRSDSLNGTYDEIAKLTTADTLSYTDTSVMTEANIGSKFYYIVRSYINALGNDYVSRNDTTVYAIISPATTTLTGKALTYTSVRLSWTAVSGATGYQVLRASSKTGTYSTIKTQSGVTLDLTGLTTGSVYYYKVRAFTTKSSVQVYGKVSNIVSLAPNVVAPSWISTTPYTKQVKIKWGAVSGASGYKIYRASTSAGTYEQIASVSGKSNTTYTNTNLSCDTTYYYRVAAYRTVDDTSYTGAKSSYKSATTYVVTPEKPTYTVKSVTSIKLAWSSVSGAEGYRVYAATSETGSYSKLAEVGSGTLTYSVTDMTLATYRYFKIMAKASKDGVTLYSDYSEVLAARTYPLGTSSIVRSAYSSSSISVRWAKVTGADGYIIYYKRKGTTTNVKVADLRGNDVTQYSITGLSSSTSYYVIIRSYCLDGDNNRIIGGYKSILTSTK